MLKALQTARSGMAAQQLQMDITANNLANINTTGYKKDKVEFAELVRQRLGHSGLPVVPADRAAVPESGSGTRLSGIDKVFTQGQLQQTKRPLDLAINGPGFFVVSPTGAEADRYYTRDGAFYLNEEGYLVNAAGYRLLGRNRQGNLQPIRLQLNNEAGKVLQSISVTADGKITALDASGRELRFTGNVDTVAVVRFANNAGLAAAGNNLYAATAASGQPEYITEASVVSGYLEASNVDLAEEMIKMIEAQKAYALNSRAVRTADEMWAAANNIRK